MENLIPKTENGTISNAQLSEKTSVSDTLDQENLKKLIYRAVNETVDENGWADLGPVGSYLVKTQPDFDPRSYGFGKLSDLIRSIPFLDLKTGANNALAVRRQSYRRFIRQVQEIIEQCADENGFTEFNIVCSKIKQRDPDFNPKTLGHKTVSQAVRAIHDGWIEIREADTKECIRNIKQML